MRLTQNYRLEYCVGRKGLVCICHWKGSTVILTAPVESYDERLKRSAEDEDGYIRRTAEFFPKKEHLHILDIGIGTGTGLTAILEQNPTIYVDGIDCADKMLSEIPKNLPEHKERIRTICGDFFKYELEPESYDGAVSMMALHYYSREENLELFHRVCRSIKRAGSFC